MSIFDGSIWKGFDSGILAKPRWTDKSFPATQAKLGILNKPDFDFVNLGLLFPENDTSEKVYILDQMWHIKKLGTSLRLHIHFVQNSVNVPKFVCEYRFYNNGETIPGWTTIDTDSGPGLVFTYTSGSIVNLARFPDIPSPSGENVSAILDLIIYRNDSNVTGDVLVKYIDYHFQVDSDGSRQEFVK
jgi:hypothetical protein